MNNKTNNTEKTEIFAMHFNWFLGNVMPNSISFTQKNTKIDECSLAIFFEHETWIYDWISTGSIELNWNTYVLYQLFYEFTIKFSLFIWK